MAGDKIKEALEVALDAMVRVLDSEPPAASSLKEADADRLQVAVEQAERALGIRPE